MKADEGQRTKAQTAALSSSPVEILPSALQWKKYFNSFTKCLDCKRQIRCFLQLLPTHLLFEKLFRRKLLFHLFLLKCFREQSQHVIHLLKTAAAIFITNTTAAINSKRNQNKKLWPNNLPLTLKFWGGKNLAWTGPHANQMVQSLKMEKRSNATNNVKRNTKESTFHTQRGDGSAGPTCFRFSSSSFFRLSSLSASLSFRGFFFLIWTAEASAKWHKHP